MNKITTFAPGKIIISGEHSVVHGQPALITTIDKGIEISLNDQKMAQEWQQDRYLQQILQIWQKDYPDFSINFNFAVVSNLPQKSGLGSSAAFASAVFQSLAKWQQVTLSLERLFELVKQAENFIHVTSSGVDPAAVVYGGFLKFQRLENGFNIQKIKMEL